ncbi:sigma factor-like helix-turn-helix DNA-binding protein [Desulfosporosinus acidiphilus]|uniref:sigma factor-like helix-turn-helix DNA-binding protein n=1 Tax=Desulfosporosinus acidiphilus TaxID=885581 RepID=UPI00030A24C4|nr:sigma factor-like helix-turn-helix DNA-binding protein [Desulfosporosinus acidiphilus]
MLSIQELQRFQNYKFRVEHLLSAIDKLEKKLMNLRIGYQILLRVVKFQVSRRTVKITAYRTSHQLYQEIIHLRSLLNSERYQLYYSYYNTAKTIEGKLKLIEKQNERQNFGREALRTIKYIKTTFRRKVKVTSKRKGVRSLEDRTRLRVIYADIQDILTYLETGSPPPLRRDLSRRSRKQREVFFSSMTDWKLERILVSRESVIRPNRNLPENRILAYYLGHLSEREREAFTLHHGQGLAVGEVARIMRCTVGTIDQLLFRAHRTLELVKQRGEPPPTLF